MVTLRCTRFQTVVIASLAMLAFGCESDSIRANRADNPYGTEATQEVTFAHSDTQSADEPDVRMSDLFTFPDFAASPDGLSADSDLGFDRCEANRQDAEPAVDQSLPLPDAWDQGAQPVDSVDVEPADQVIPTDMNADVPWSPTDNPLNQEGQWTYLIVTTPEMQPAYEQLADWRRQTGLATHVTTLNQLLATPETPDLAAALRQLLKAAVSLHGTQIVLLGGDSPLLPHRTIFVHTTLGAGDLAYQTESWAATELYFSDLDGNWDADGDGIYGEFEDNLDMLPDVAVGRVPSQTLAEAQMYVDKVLTYERGVTADYQQRVLFLSEPTGFGDIDSSVLLDRWDGAIFDSTYTIQKLYENASDYPDAEQNSTAAEMAALNAGKGIVAHLGHGSEDSFAYLDATDLLTLHNGSRQSIFFSCACYSGNFVEPRATGELFVLNALGGGVAYIGNTDIGIGFPPGAAFLQDLLARLLADDPPRLGSAFAQARTTFVPGANGTWTDDNAVRYTQFVVVLLGDPALRMWRVRPKSPNVSWPERLVVGQPLDLQVSSGGAPIAGATVTFWQPGTRLFATRSDARGFVRLHTPDLQPGNVTVTVSGQDLTPVVRDLPVTER